MHLFSWKDISSRGSRFRNRRALLQLQVEQPLRAFGFAPAIAGQSSYVTDESGEKTYSAAVGADGTLSNLKLYAEQGRRLRSKGLFGTQRPKTRAEDLL
jgi:hypothetical protein